MRGDAKQRIASIVEQALWGHTACSYKHALLAKAIIDSVDSPSNRWKLFLTTLEEVDSAGAIEQARAAALRGEVGTQSSTFDVSRDSWALYLAWEETLRGENVRVLAIEIMDSCDYTRRDEVIRTHLLDFRAPPAQMEPEPILLDLQSILDESRD